MGLLPGDSDGELPTNWLADERVSLEWAIGLPRYNMTYDYINFEDKRQYLRSGFRPPHWQA